MFDDIQKIIFPNYLSSFEKTKLDELSKSYSPIEIISVYKRYGYKPIRYVEKVLQSKKKEPLWLGEDIKNQNIDNECKNQFDDFNDFLEGFRNA